MHVSSGLRERRTEARAALRVGALVFVAAAVISVIIDLITGSATPWWYAILIPAVLLLLIPAIRIINVNWSRTGPDGLPLDDHPVTVEEKLFRECEAMSCYALKTGLPVPASVLETLALLSPRFVLASADRGARHRVIHSTGPPTVNVAPATPNVEGDGIKRLAHAHQQLTHLVAPATPQTLRLLTEGSYNRILPFLGRVRLVRLLMYVSLILLAGLIGLAFKADFRPTTGRAALTGANLVFQATGITKLYNALYLLSASGLGACFYALFKANGFISTGTYDPNYEPTYWVRLTLGMIAGVLLALLIPIGNSGRVELTKPLLALLGGFSADVVYRILGRLVETLEALVQGTNQEAVAAVQQSAKARAELEAIRNRTQQAQGIIKLQAAMSNGADPAKVQQLFDSMLADLLPDSAGADGSAGGDGSERNVEASEVVKMPEAVEGDTGEEVHADAEGSTVPDK